MYHLFIRINRHNIKIAAYPLIADAIANAQYHSMNCGTKATLEIYQQTNCILRFVDGIKFEVKE